MNRKINHIHERALRLVYQDCLTSFEGLLKKDNSVTFHRRNIRQVALEMYKVRHDLSSPFIKVLLSAKVIVWELVRVITLKGHMLILLRKVTGL